MLKHQKTPHNKKPAGAKKATKKIPAKKAPQQQRATFTTKAQRATPLAKNTVAKTAKKTTINTTQQQQQLLKQQKRFMGAGWGYSNYVPAEEVELRILALMSELPHVNQEKLTPKAHFYKDLGLDSLNQVELVFMLEQEFEVQIDDDHAILIESVPEAVHYFSHTPYAV